MSRVVHFEIPADNPERAEKFYSETFGWKFQKWAGPQDYWPVTTGPNEQPGINGGLLRRPHPGAPVVNTIQVEDLNKSLEAVAKHGGKTVVPRMAIPGVGHLAYCQDTEGNTLGVMQPDTSAR
jgi:predicted enzyme related to lactoylglutathione lyase